MPQLKYWNGSAWVSAVIGAQGITGSGTQGIQGIQGTQGIIGNKGGVTYAFSTTTTDADPGSGLIRYNNATIASVSQIFINNVDALGNTQTVWLDTLDDSTTSATRSVLSLAGNASGSTTINQFTVIGAITVGSGYYKVPVSYISGSLPANGASLAVNSSRVGNQGNSGTQGTTGTQGISGTQGTTGTQGLNGTFAAQGIQGPAGLQGTASAVTQIIAGSNITISPGGGTGAVTINSSSGGTGTAALSDIFMLGGM